MLSRLHSSISSSLQSYESFFIDKILIQKFAVTDPSSQDSIFAVTHALLASMSIIAGVMTALKTTNPISVVLSGSMEPTMRRGDVLILTKRVSKMVEICDCPGSDHDEDDNKRDLVKQKVLLKYGDISCGDIVVFDTKSLQKRQNNSNDKKKIEKMPNGAAASSAGIVHRVISVHTEDNGDVFVLTKGDNNTRDDRSLYPAPTFFLPLNDETFVGKVVRRIPRVGYLNLMLVENLGPVGRSALFAVSIGIVYLIDLFERRRERVPGSSMMAAEVKKSVAQ